MLNELSTNLYNINKFSVCYKFMESKYNTYTLKDIAFHNGGWYKYINEDKKIILIKYTNNEEKPNWSFDNISELSNGVSKVILAFIDKRKLSYMEIKLPKIENDMDVEKGKITYNNNILSFYPKLYKKFELKDTVSYIFDLPIKDISKIVNRYKSLMERNQQKIFNYLLFELFTKNNESKVLKESEICDLKSCWNRLKLTNSVYKSRENLQGVVAVDDDIRIAYQESYKKDFDIEVSDNSGMRKVRDRNIFFNHFLEDKKLSIEERKEPINEFIDEVKNYVNTYYKYYQENTMSFKEFKALWNVENRACGYCGVTEQDIKKLDKNNQIETKRFYSRGKTMEIDKIDPNGEYESTNIILSCYWCNNAKTDEYDLCEFKEIARGINAVWSKRLGIQVLFPENTYVSEQCT